MLARAISAGAAALMASAVMAASASAATPPSLRLFAADRHLTLTRGDVDSMQIGLWVAATGGEFRVQVRRPGYGAWQGEQIDAQTGAPLRAVPGALLDGAHGFARFLDIRFLATDGSVAGHRTLSFCPGYSERVSDDGPRTPTYGGFGFSSSCQPGFPFAVGNVWGIDRGWAGAVGTIFERPHGPRLRLPPGRYRVLAQIRAPFRRLLAIPPDQAQAQLAVRVKRNPRPPHGPPPPVPAPELIRISAAAARPRARAAATPDPAALPDLVALPPWQMVVAHRRHRDLLGFAGTPWNAGPGPLVVEGFRAPGENIMRGVQYFIGPTGDVTGSAPAGHMAYHAGGGHNHWHFLQFVAYTLLTRSGRRVVTGHKESFCLAPTDAVDLTLPGAELSPDPFGLGSSCGDERSIWLREALPAGWGDTYTPYVSGQDFDITHVPNGRYLVEMRVNPLGELYETTTTNDVARRRIVLRGRPGARRVQVGAWHGIRR